MFDVSIIQKIVVYAIPLIFAITLHEAAHAYVAHKFGDDTAISLGRLSINPLHHIDLVGTIIFPLIGIVLGGFIFGWAKPVPINFGRLRHPKWNLFWIALAGPMSNLAMAIFWGLIFKLSTYVDAYFGAPMNLMAQAGIAINISLMLLNLIPILPLDGGRMLFAVLPDKQAMAYAKVERYGLLILVGLLLVGGLTYVIQPLYASIVSFILSLVG